MSKNKNKVSKKIIRLQKDKLRLSIYRSNKNISAQIIDDIEEKTLVSANSLELKLDTTNATMDTAKKVGQLLAEKAKKKKIKTIYFDRGCNTYSGKIKALCEAARDNGLDFLIGVINEKPRQKKQQTSQPEEEKDFEKVVKINRVNKVVKGGKRLAFRAFTICGDNEGSFGLGLGKSKEVPVAIKKAIEKAKKNYKKLTFMMRQFHMKFMADLVHQELLSDLQEKVQGVIAGGAVRVILEAIGIKNVVAKSLGSRNPLNVALATENALLKCKEQQKEEADREVSISIPSKIRRLRCQQQT